MPRLVIETLYYWVVRSGCFLIKIETDVDDQVILNDHCDFIGKMLSIVLQPNMKNVEQDFTIDLRNFKNFEIKDGNKNIPKETLELLGLKVFEYFLEWFLVLQLFGIWGNWWAYEWSK